MSAPVEAPEPIPTLQNSIKQLGQLVKDPESELDEKELPGLDKLIGDWYDDDTEVTKEAFARRILQVFRDSTHNEVYDDVKSKLPGQRGTVLDKFVDGEITAKDAGALLAELEGTPAGAPPVSGLHVQNLFLSSAKKDAVPDRKFIKVRDHF
ncbi:hypothetical protein NW767_002728 [Fusarium falciforme]|nr:hypothetical protein NW767_002728 [Fusarium falciforme]